MTTYLSPSKRLAMIAAIRRDTWFTAEAASALVDQILYAAGIELGHDPVAAAAPELLAAAEFALECATVRVVDIEVMRAGHAKVIAMLEAAITKAYGT